MILHEEASQGQRVSLTLEENMLHMNILSPGSLKFSYSQSGSGSTGRHRGHKDQQVSTSNGSLPEDKSNEAIFFH